MPTLAARFSSRFAVWHMPVLNISISRLISHAVTTRSERPTDGWRSGVDIPRPPPTTQIRSRRQDSLRSRQAAPPPRAPPAEPQHRPGHSDRTVSGADSPSLPLWPPPAGPQHRPGHSDRTVSGADSPSLPLGPLPQDHNTGPVTATGQSPEPTGRPSPSGPSRRATTQAGSQRQASLRSRQPVPPPRPPPAGPQHRPGHSDRTVSGADSPSLPLGPLPQDHNTGPVTATGQSPEPTGRPSPSGPSRRATTQAGSQRQDSLRSRQRPPLPLGPLPQDHNTGWVTADRAGERAVERAADRAGNSAGSPPADTAE